MDKIIIADLYRYTGKKTFSSLLFCMRKFPGFKFTLFWRLSIKYKKNLFLSFFFHFFYRRYSIKYGFQIPKSVQIGQGLMMAHFGGIVINSRSIIGKNCNILQSVTIGNALRGKLKGTPVIGDRVYIGPGAVVIGSIKIGNDVLIAPNSFVNIDVPDHSIVVGNPATIHSRNEATLEYIKNIS